MLANQIQGRADAFQAAGGPETTERLLQVKREARISILNICDSSGRPLAGGYPDRNVHVPIDADPVLRQALKGKVAWGTMLLDESRLRMEGYTCVGESLDVRSDQDLIIITGNLPVADSFKIDQDLRSDTEGRAFWQMSFERYEPISKARLEEYKQKQ